jgi:integrase
VRKQLTTTDLRKLKIGETICGACLQVTRTKTDYVFKTDKRYQGIRVCKTIGFATLGMTAEKAYMKMAEVCQTSILNRSRLHIPILLRDALNEYLRRETINYGRNLVAKTQNVSEMVVFFKDLPLLEIEAQHIEDYTAWLNDKHLKPQTVVHRLNTLTHFFNKAESWGWVEKVPKVVKPKVVARRITYFAKDEVRRLLDVARSSKAKHLYLYCLIGFYTALRASEILSLRWEDIDIANEKIHVSKGKTGYRIAPMANTLKSHLKTIREDQGWLFPHGKTRILSCKKSFATLVKSIGLDPRKYTSHVMRHTVATLLIQSGVSTRTVMSVTGHANLSTLQRYAHVAEHDGKDAVNLLSLDF